MDVSIILKIALIGIATAILNRVLVQSGRDEVALMTTLAGVVVICMMVLSLISKLFSTIDTMLNF
ncbi:MAG: stage III sporulation protein AC [Bacillota bacterium]